MARNNIRCGSSNNDSAGNGNGNAPGCGFFSLPPAQFAILASLIGILIIDNLDLDQQNAIGNFIMSVGQTIATASAQGELLQSGDQQNIRVRQQIKLLKKQLEDLEAELDGQN